MRQNVKTAFPLSKRYQSLPEPCLAGDRAPGPAEYCRCLNGQPEHPFAGFALRSQRARGSRAHSVASEIPRHPEVRQSSARISGHGWLSRTSSNTAFMSNRKTHHCLFPSLDAPSNRAHNIMYRSILVHTLDRQAYNLKVAGSNSSPATTQNPLETLMFPRVFSCPQQAYFGKLANLWKNFVSRIRRHQLPHASPIVISGRNEEWRLPPHCRRKEASVVALA